MKLSTSAIKKLFACTAVAVAACATTPVLAQDGSAYGESGKAKAFPGIPSERWNRSAASKASACG